MATGARKISDEAILLVTPPNSVRIVRENALDALAIDRAANLPVMRHNDPDRMGVNMGAKFLDHVGRNRNICAIKDSSGDINRVYLLARDYPPLQISGGMDDPAFEFFAWFRAILPKAAAPCRRRCRSRGCLSWAASLWRTSNTAPRWRARVRAVRVLKSTIAIIEAER